jgi:hypothetical protein
MTSRAFLAMAVSFFAVLVLLVVFSPSVSSSPSSQSLPTFTPVPTFTPLPSPTPTPAPPRAIAVFTVTEWKTDNYACSSNCSYTEDWRRPLSGTTFILYEGGCLTISLSHVASIVAADNHPGPSRYRYFHLSAAPLTTSPVTLTIGFSATASAGPASCWCNQSICGRAESGFGAKVSCWDQSARVWFRQIATCGISSYVFTSTAVRCLPDHIRDFYFDYDFDVAAGCFYSTCGGSISSRGNATLVICAGDWIPFVPSGCRCEGPGTCFWCPLSQRFEVRGTNPPANGVVQLSDWTEAELWTLDYGHELIFLPQFDMPRKITLTQPGYWYLDVDPDCPLPLTRGDLGYLSGSLSLDVVCPNDTGYVYAYYAPSPTTRLICTIPAGTWLVTGFPPVAAGQDVPWLRYTRVVTLASPIFVISNSYAISEVWTVWDSGGGLRPGIPTSTVPIVTRPIDSRCIIVPPDLFARTFKVDQVEVCLDLVAFRFNGVPWGDALLDALVLGVAAILVFAGIRSLRE